MNCSTGASGRRHRHLGARDPCFYVIAVRAPLFAALLTTAAILFAGDGEQRVAASLAALSSPQGQVALAGQHGGFVGTSAPDLAEGHQLAEDLAAFLKRSAVVDGDFCRPGSRSPVHAGWPAGPDQPRAREVQ